MSDISGAVSRLRITGMATGMDVDSMVKKLMDAERLKQDKLKQQQTYLQWTQDAYRDQINTLKAFSSKNFDILSSSSILNENTFSGFETSVNSGTSVSIKAGSGAAAGNYKINVINMATNASKVGTTILNTKTMATGTPPVTINKGNNDELMITVGGNTKTINIAEGSYNPSSLASAVNSKIAEDADLKDNVRAIVDSTGKNIKFESILKISTGDAAKTFTVDLGDGSGAKTITLNDGTYSMSALATQINSKLSAAGVDANKFKAVVSDSGNGIKFSNTYTSDVTVDGTSVTSGSTSAIISKYEKDFSLSTGTQGYKPNVDAATNTVSYDKVLSSAFGNNSLSIKIGNNSAETLNLFDQTDHTSALDIPYNSTDSDAWDKVISSINYAISNNANLNGKVSAEKSADGTGIVFKSTVSDQINVSGSASTALGFGNSVNLSMNLNEKAANIFGAGDISFKINNTTFNYSLGGADSKKTLNDIISDIETKENVDISYSQLTKRFSITSKATGAAQTISASDTTGSFVGTLFGGAVNATGTDAQVEITEPGQPKTTVYQASNDFAIDGISYSLKDIGETSFTTGGNPNKIVDKVKDFINQYNSLIQGINDKISEKKQYTYKPLTDSQKADMKDDDIKKWEDKAKQGIISNDSDLQSMLTKMRTSFYDAVKDAGISLNDIGLSTTNDLSKSGQIVIDEEKLRTAIQNNPDKVMNIFIKKSNSQPSYIASDSKDINAAADRQTRYNEEGIFQRLNDIMQDYTRTFNGKGTLIKKAGIKGDSTEYNNAFTDRIKEKLTAISNMEKALQVKEENYYKKFSALETAMSKMNSQQAWLAQQLGSK